ncbi:Ku protein [Microaerobacter geothermalis]|uniref:non-homologous end joining protein Ku n=1 Tax=Microaerobacter geothermalis TaxID=674972 RepID=UPI001F30290D|nr:Ku protein [Microaerobacter geothermalis]MCF6093344.1 Ku protein [Microaerobacter geothermalis]
MHTMWKGSISFGLVNIPVKMFAATEDKDIKFRYLHKKCKTPIKYVRTCSTCDREVGWDEIIKGYEYEPGRFIIIEEEELEAIAPETKRTVEILDFVNLEEIDPIYFDKSYYLSPNETGDKAYALLRKAMNETGKIGVAKITIRNRESLAVIRTLENCIVLETIYYPDEVRGIAQLPALPDETKLNENELKMAIQLIENLAAPFDPTRYKDKYRESLQELIQKKMEGEEIVAAPVAPRRNVIDLMDALQASLEATKPAKKKKAGGPRRKAAKEKATI